MAGELRYLVQRGDNLWARIVVPVELRSIIGKTELRTALGSNRKIAERELHAAVAAFHQVLADARAKAEVSNVVPIRSRPRPLTLSQIAQTHYAEELAIDDSERNHPIKDEIADMTWSREREGHVDALKLVAAGRASADEAEAAVGWAVEKFVARGSTKVERGTSEWHALARMLAQVQIEAVDAAIARDAGRDTPDPKLTVLSEPLRGVLPTATISKGARPVSILALLERYLRELKAGGHGAEAERRWTPCFKALVRFLGHDDARHFSKADAVAWKDHLIHMDGLSLKTVRDTNLASLRAVFRWAKENGHVEDNPIAEVRVKVPKQMRGREKGFTDAEALAILTAAQNYQPVPSQNPATRENAYSTAAKRWLPWLCALTGARVAEMAQLRCSDVQNEHGVTFIRITPDAGAVKTGHYRDVAIHPQLVELGFLVFVKARGIGPLFFDASKAPKGPRHPSKFVATRVSNWVRSLNVAGEDVDPSHGWRHRFKTVGREAGIDSRILDALQGHAPRTAGDDYGDITLKTRDAAIRKIPDYVVAN